MFNSDYYATDLVFEGDTDGSYMMVKSSDKTELYQATLEDKKYVPGKQIQGMVHKIEESCGDPVPHGMVAAFDTVSQSCPKGWTQWQEGKTTVQCNTSNCNLIICKND